MQTISKYLLFYFKQDKNLLGRICQNVKNLLMQFASNQYAFTWLCKLTMWTNYE